MRKPVYAILNNKGENQPVHLHSLISLFAIQYLDSVLCNRAISQENLSWGFFDQVRLKPACSATEEG